MEQLNRLCKLLVLMLSLFCDCAHCSEQVVRAEPADKQENPLTCYQPPEISLWERLGNASAVDTESSDFSWNLLSSLHHTEHSSSSEHSEDEMSKVLEVCFCWLRCQFQHFFVVFSIVRTIIIICFYTFFTISETNLHVRESTRINTV